MARKLFIEEILAFSAAGIVILITLMLYQNVFSPGETIFLMVRYFTFGYPFYNLFFFFIYLAYFWKFYLRLASVISDAILQKKPFPKGIAREFIGYVLEPVRLLAPLVLVGLTFYTLLSRMSYELRFSGKDLLFLQADTSLFRVIPFVWLPSLLSPSFFSTLFQVGYLSLGAVMSASLALLFLFFRPLLFREAVLAFMISIILAYPFFYFLPCQDPNNYFLRNLRGVSFPEEITEGLKSYHPSPPAAGFIAQIANAETNKERDNAVPVSCFPSMHAVWAFFVIYFLALARRWSLALTIPWTVLLLAGGVYFAQHYVVDYIAAVPVAIASVYLAGLLLQLEERIKRKNTPSGLEKKTMPAEGEI
ncbi:MAG: phosphatase PAP2 family protein [Candidatus Portnoybacteria bacterium]|nr:phosphatase PAP2 family protein [Candidatus Portnoybacteria bacterium]